MARILRSAKLDTRTARERLPTGGSIQYVDLGIEGADLGYRKGKTGGKWLLRRYAGDKKYSVETIGLADDLADPDGVTVLSFRQAQTEARKRHELLSRKEKGLGAVEVGPYTVADAIRDYLAFKEAEGSKSVVDSRTRADALIIPALGKVETSRLTTKAIRDWRDDVATTPARLRTRAGDAQKYAEFNAKDKDAVRSRRASANRTLTILKAALNHAWREGRVESDEEWRRVQPFREVDAARQRYLTFDEVRRLINSTEDAFRDLVEAALQTGARYSELAALKAQDYNSDNGTVFIRQSKSGKARHIILTDEGQALFDRLSAGKLPSALMLTRDDKSAWATNYHVRPMKTAVERAKLGDDVSFHILRHTWASLAVMNGVPLMVVAENLGHADTRTVEKHYGHLAQSYKADAIRANAPRFGVSPANVIIVRGKE